MGLIRLLIFAVGVSFLPVAAAGQSAPGAAPGPPAEVNWHELRTILGRLEAEYDRLQVIYTEMTQLSDAVRSLDNIRNYPPACTRLTDPAALREINIAINDRTERIALFRNRADLLREPLLDAIGMLRELIYEDPAPEMLDLLMEESKERVTAILKLKREINLSWKSLEETLNRLYGYAGLLFPLKKDEGGFEAEFFEVLYYNLGLSSERFMERLNAYKDSVTHRMDMATTGSIAQTELEFIKEKYARGDFPLMERELKAMLKRFDKASGLDGIYYYLGQASQALGKNQNAVDCYTRIGKGSPYFIDAVAGMLQSLFAQGKYPRVEELFEKMKGDFSGKGSLNRIYYVVAQAYYELKREKEIVDLSALAEKKDPYYLGVLYVLGQSYTRKEDYNTARSIFRTLSSFSGVQETDRRFVDLSRLGLAHLDFTEKKYEKALTQYLSLLDEPELFAEALEGIVWCYLYLGNYYKAEVALKTLVNQAPAEPSGCEAMLLLARNYLKKTQLEWQLEKELLQSNDKIDKYLQILEKRRADGSMDTAAYRDSRRRLLALMDANRTTGSRADNIGEYFRRSNETVNFLIRSYQTGEFIASPFKDQREEILLRIRDLYLKSKMAIGGTLKRDYFIQRDRRQEKRNRIAETVVQARIFKIRVKLEERGWRQDFGLLQMQDIAREERMLKGDTLMADSVRQAHLKALEEKRFTAQRFMSEGADLFQQVIVDLQKLRQSALNEEQEAFAYYYLGEMYYLMEQELYLEREDEYGRQMEAYQLALEKYESGAVKVQPEVPKTPKIDYGEAEKYFGLLVEKHPKSRFVDAALYSLAFCYTEEGRRDDALRLGEELLKKYPDSYYAAQTALLLGEYYFDNSKLEAALEKYRLVLKFPESRWFDKALYKMGWTYYRLSETRKAVSTFFYLISEQNLLPGQEMDWNLFSKSLLSKESMDYIAISFAEADTADNDLTGLKKAKRFVRKLPSPELSARVLHKLGDVYREQLKYDNAITTYRDLKKLYPNYSQMPAVMYSAIDCYELKGQVSDQLSANEGRRQLFANYNHNSEWARNVQDSAAVVLGDSMAEKALLEAAGFFYSMAVAKESKDMYRKVIDMYWDYLKVFPHREKASECHYYIAEILFGTGDYLEAAKQYMEVSRRYKRSKYVQTAAMNAIVAAQNYLKQEEEKRQQKQEQR